jgi:hypothetical protein
MNTKTQNLITLQLHVKGKKADLNGSVDSISGLKPKGPGFESRIRQGIYVGGLVSNETDA